MPLPPTRFDSTDLKKGADLVRIKLLNQNNLAPVALPDVFQATDTAFEKLSMRANDTDPNGDYLYAEIIKTGVGAVELLNNYDIKYTAPLSFSGNDTIIYRACDLGGLCSQPTSIVIQVTASGQRPLLSDDVVQTYQSIEVTSNVASNDDYQNEGYTIKITQKGTKGNAVLVGDSAVKYSPISTFIGLDSVKYSICKTYGYCDTATLYIDVLPHPNPPITEPDYVLFQQVFILVYPLANDQNPTGGEITMTILEGPFFSGSKIKNITSSRFSYENSNYSNVTMDSILYQACNVSGLCSQEWIRFEGKSAGVEEQNRNIGFTLFPNPVKDFITISFEQIPNNATYVITDLLGRSIVSSSIETKELKLDIHSLAKGTYLFHLDIDGKKKSAKKFVKE